MEQILVIAGTVVAVQLLLAAGREWRNARRIIAVGGLCSEIYAEHGCVPLQFAGSYHRAARAAVAVTGFFMVRPKTRKHAFAVRRVVGMRAGNAIDYRNIRPRDDLRVMLDEGEHHTVLDRSMRRGVLSFYRTVAIRELESPSADEHAHCVTIRTQGHLVGDGDASSRWLEYAAIAAPPRSNRRSGRTLLADLPEDAIELVVIPPETYRRARDDAAARRDGPLRGWLMRRNPSPAVATAHFIGKYIISPAVLALVVALYGGTDIMAPVRIVLIMSVVLGIVFLVRFGLDVLQRYLRQRTRTRPPQAVEATSVRGSETPRQPISIRHIRSPPPDVWTGATAHCMGAGRLINATGARSFLAHAWRPIFRRTRPRHQSLRPIQPSVAACPTGPRAASAHVYPSP